MLFYKTTSRYLVTLTPSHWIFIPFEKEVNNGGSSAENMDKFLQRYVCRLITFTVIL